MKKGLLVMLITVGIILGSAIYADYESDVEISIIDETTKSIHSNDIVVHEKRLNQVIQEGSIKEFLTFEGNVKVIDDKKKTVLDGYTFRYQLIEER